MAFVTKRYVECDRCGASEHADEHDAEFDIAKTHPGWIRASGDRLLCPECAPGYDLLVARHKVELDEYVNGGA